MTVTQDQLERIRDSFKRDPNDTNHQLMFDLLRDMEGAGVPSKQRASVLELMHQIAEADEAAKGGEWKIDQPTISGALRNLDAALKTFNAANKEKYAGIASAVEAAAKAAAAPPIKAAPPTTVAARAARFVAPTSAGAGITIVSLREIYDLLITHGSLLQADMESAKISPSMREAVRELLYGSGDNNISRIFLNPPLPTQLTKAQQEDIFRTLTNLRNGLIELLQENPNLDAKSKGYYESIRTAIDAAIGPIAAAPASPRPAAPAARFATAAAPVEPAPAAVSMAIRAATHTPPPVAATAPVKPAPAAALPATLNPAAAASDNMGIAQEKLQAILDALVAAQENIDPAILKEAETKKDKNLQAQLDALISLEKAITSPDAVDRMESLREAGEALETLKGMLGKQYSTFRALEIAIKSALETVEVKEQPSAPAATLAAVVKLADVKPENRPSAEDMTKLLKRLREISTILENYKDAFEDTPAWQTLHTALQEELSKPKEQIDYAKLEQPLASLSDLDDLLTPIKLQQKIKGAGKAIQQEDLAIIGHFQNALIAAARTVKKMVEGQPLAAQAAPPVRQAVPPPSLPPRPSAAALQAFQATRSRSGSAATQQQPQAAAAQEHKGPPPPARFRRATLLVDTSGQLTQEALSALNKQLEADLPAFKAILETYGERLKMHTKQDGTTFAAQWTELETLLAKKPIDCGELLTCLDGLFPVDRSKLRADPRADVAFETPLLRADAERLDAFRQNLIGLQNTLRQVQQAAPEQAESTSTKIIADLHQLSDKLSQSKTVKDVLAKTNASLWIVDKDGKKKLWLEFELANVKSAKDINLKILLPVLTAFIVAIEGQPARAAFAKTNMSENVKNLLDILKGVEGQLQELNKQSRDQQALSRDRWQSIYGVQTFASVKDFEEKRRKSMGSKQELESGTAYLVPIEGGRMAVYLYAESKGGFEQIGTLDKREINNLVQQGLLTEGGVLKHSYGIPEPKEGVKGDAAVLPRQLLIAWLAEKFGPGVEAMMGARPMQKRE